MSLVAALVVCAPATPAFAADAAPTPPPAAANGPAPVVVDAAAGTAPVPDLRTKAWVLADLDTGRDPGDARPRPPVRPASTLKLLTALTVAPRLSPEQPYRAVKADEEVEGNRVVMYAGLKYSVADLMHAALLPSANDAADALARANGGIDVTVAQMNAEARGWVPVSTTWPRTPSGLDGGRPGDHGRDMAASDAPPSPTRRSPRT